LGVVDHYAALSGPTANLQRQQLTANVPDEARGTSANEMPSRQPQSINQMATPMQPVTSLKLPFPTFKLGTYSGVGSLRHSLSSSILNTAYRTLDGQNEIASTISVFVSNELLASSSGTRDRNVRLGM
jgi:hypothetical protein